MSKNFEISEVFAVMSEDERIKALNANAEEVNNSYTYFRDLSDEEIFEKMEEVNQLWSEMNKIEEQKKELAAIAKPLKIRSNQINREVAQKQLEFCETVWKVNNFENNMIEYINSVGEIVRSIRMRGGVQMRLDKAVNE